MYTSEQDCLFETTLIAAPPAHRQRLLCAIARLPLRRFSASTAGCQLRHSATSNVRARRRTCHRGWFQRIDFGPFVPFRCWGSFAVWLELTQVVNGLIRQTWDTSDVRRGEKAQVCHRKDRDAAGFFCATPLMPPALFDSPGCTRALCAAPRRATLHKTTIPRFRRLGPF